MARGSGAGRPPKTSQAHILAGTFREDRHQPTVEPPKGRPDSPKPLDGDALAEWDRMILRLESCGTLAKVHDAAIYQYALLFAETEQIHEIQADTAAGIDRLEENLSGLEGKDLVDCFQEISKLRQLEARYVTQVRQGRIAIKQFLVEFGLTPAAQGRVKLPAAATKSAAQSFREAKGA